MMIDFKLKNDPKPLEFQLMKEKESERMQNFHRFTYKERETHGAIVLCSIKHICKKTKLSKHTYKDCITKISNINRNKNNLTSHNIKILYHDVSYQVK